MFLFPSSRRFLIWKFNKPYVDQSIEQTASERLITGQLEGQRKPSKYKLTDFQHSGG